LTTIDAHEVVPDGFDPRLKETPTSQVDAVRNASLTGAQVPLVKRVMPSARRGIPSRSTVNATDSTAMSFIMLTESQLQHSNQPSASSDQRPETSIMSRGETSDQSFLHKSTMSMRLFEILSSRSDVDHPICKDCTELLLAALQSRLTESIRERDAYAGYLRNLKSHTVTEKELTRASEDLARSEEREGEAFSELLRSEQEKSQLEQELADLDAEVRVLDEEESRYWQERNAFEQKLGSLNDTHDALSASLDHDLQQLARLERTNVYNDAFFISHDGPFGTINGLRLGRLSPPNHVEWPEINAAWGTTALLIATVAERLKFTFNGYILQPMGSSSRIEKLFLSESVSSSQLTGESLWIMTERSH
jgi:beclin 1